MPIHLQPVGSDLLNSGADVLVNTVNCVGVMGAGIALQFKQRFPQMFADYRQRCLQGQVAVGAIDTHAVTVPGTDRRVLIANFPTKQHWRNPSQLQWIDTGLVALRELMLTDLRQARSIAIPPLGCGHGGLDWDVVLPRIVAAMTPVSNTGVEVLIYPPARR